MVELAPVTADGARSSPPCSPRSGCARPPLLERRGAPAARRPRAPARRAGERATIAARPRQLRAPDRRRAPSSPTACWRAARDLRDPRHEPRAAGDRRREPRRRSPPLRRRRQARRSRLLRRPRGRPRRPGFADRRRRRPVAEICRRLDGLPLAIELAAARLRTLPVEQLAARLDDRFRLLTGGSRTALPRQRTLRAVVDWSWDLLDEPERALAARLAVFARGATPRAPPRSSTATRDVLDLLAALVDKSLLPVAGDPRYRMLETIREYGIEKLAEAGELEADPHRARALLRRARRGGRAAPARPRAASTWFRSAQDRARRTCSPRCAGSATPATRRRRAAAGGRARLVLDADGRPGRGPRRGCGSRSRCPGDADPVDRLIAERILAMIAAATGGRRSPSSSNRSPSGSSTKATG